MSKGSSRRPAAKGRYSDGYDKAFGKVSESVVQRALIDKLESTFEDIYVRKIQQTTFSHGGIPDLLVCHKGLFIGIEVKTTKGRVSALQIHEMKLIEEANGLSLICRGLEDIPRVIALLELES